MPYRGSASARAAKLAASKAYTTQLDQPYGGTDGFAQALAGAIESFRGDGLRVIP